MSDAHAEGRAARDGQGRDPGAAAGSDRAAGGRTMAAARQGLGAVVTAASLAGRLAVPVSLLSFLEARFPELRGLRSGAARAYRAEDAAVLAGLVDALYGEGRPLPEVRAELRSADGRAAAARRGLRRLGLAAGPPGDTATGDAAAAADEDAATDRGGVGATAPIPPDAIVRPRAAGVQQAAAPEPAGRDEILRELMACVRILAAARNEDPG